MSEKNFFKDNFVLIVGLTLPVLLMIGFMVASTLPRVVSDPPQYDLVFAVHDYTQVSGGIPVSVLLVVKDGTLKAQYTQVKSTNGNYYNNYWKKLYIYEAKTQKVRELPFGFPDDMEKIEGKKEEVVEATKGMKLDTTLKSPDGYELTYSGYSRSGLVNELFWGGSGSRDPKLKNGASSIKLVSTDHRAYFSYSNIEFIGWVVNSK